MERSLPTPLLTSTEQNIAAFFCRSEGTWRSQRRYFSLERGDVQEVESLLTIALLEGGCDALLHLADRHHLPHTDVLGCGLQVTWESNYVNSTRKQATGTTIFGIQGNVLYRDRGFATNKPVTALCSFPNVDTMHLRTEYGGSIFEEEIKLIGRKYRTRQTIISKAGEEQMVGQYLETRLG